MSIVVLIGAFFFNLSEKKNHFYLFIDFKDISQLQLIFQSIISFFSYLLLLNTMIPISLIVSLEFVKMI